MNSMNRLALVAVRTKCLKIRQPMFDPFIVEHPSRFQHATFLIRQEYRNDMVDFDYHRITESTVLTRVIIT